jgi:hypothetical protein
MIAFSSVTMFPIATSQGNGRQERLCKPIHEELVWNWSFNQPSPSSPLMNMIRYVGGRGFSE